MAIAMQQIYLNFDTYLKGQCLPNCCQTGAPRNDKKKVKGK